MNGYEAAAALRRHPPSDPAPVLVAHTAWGTPTDVQRALTAGFDYHVAKPPEDLAGFVDSLFEVQRS